MPILANIGELVTCAPGEPPIPDAALVWREGKVAWTGPQADLPKEFRGFERHDARRALVVPGLIDCHTHLAFGGWRADEFEQRLRGRSYLEIARAGGGIASTVRATRSATHDQLLQRCRNFADQMLKLGVTTVECKSGYGLEAASERKLLEVYRELGRQGPQRIVATFLGAHIVPPEYRDRRGEYLELLTGRLIPEAAREGLADFCDVFVEQSAFTLEEARRILEAGQAHGLGAKLHADQLSDGGGAQLAAELGAVSADHLEFISEKGIEALASAGVVAVLLPLATLYLRQAPLPAARLYERGVTVAVATDFNPGSAPSFHLPLALLLSCTCNGLTPLQALEGATIEAARALNRQHELGSLEPGKAADFVLLDAADLNHWLYHFRPNCCLETWIGGRRAHPSRAPRDHR